MSSQSAIPSSDYGTVTRDASDITQQLRDRIRYHENKRTAPLHPGYTERTLLKQSNSFRLSFMAGRLQCTPSGCAGNAFNASEFSA